MSSNILNKSCLFFCFLKECGKFAQQNRSSHLMPVCKTCFGRCSFFVRNVITGIQKWTNTICVYTPTDTSTYYGILPRPKQQSTGLLLTLALLGPVFRIPTQSKRKMKTARRGSLHFWSECRDSNPRPLGPEPSAIPNFATPR